MITRRILLNLVVILSAFVGAHAEEPTTTDKFYINDFSIAPGETKEVELCLLSTQPYRGFQVNVYMPEGLDFVYDEEEYEYVIPSVRIPLGKWSYQSEKVADGSLLISGMASNNKFPLAAGDGALFTFKVKASENLTGVVYIDLKESVMTGHEEPYVNVSIYGPDTRCEVTVTQNSSNVTLAELCKSGKEDNIYTIRDVLVAIACVEDVDNNIYLMCKDESTSVDATYNTMDFEDYMMHQEGGFGEEEWDQSNWIALFFEEPKDEEAEKIHKLVGKRLAEGTVTGMYYKHYGVNHTLDMLNADLEPFDDQLVGYIPNRYCPANFLHENLGADGATGHGNYSDRQYFFMNPKIQEVCEITFAVWNGWCFVLPKPQGEMNLTDIYGAVNVEWDFNGKGVEDPETGETHWLDDDLVTGQAYKFKAIVHKGGLPKKEGTPSLKDEVIPGEYDPDPLYESETYVIYPFDFDPKKDENIVTRIENVTVGNGEVKSVKYVNVAGIVSDRPFEGVNIVVTEYTDGSHTTTKMLRK